MCVYSTARRRNRGKRTRRWRATRKSKRRKRMRRRGMKRRRKKEPEAEGGVGRLLEKEEVEDEK